MMRLKLLAALGVLKFLAVAAAALVELKLLERTKNFSTIR
jgi:hypothetical protein